MNVFRLIVCFVSIFSFETLVFSQVGEKAHPNKKKFSTSQVSDSLSDSGYYVDGQFDYDGDGISDVKEREGVSIFEYIPGSFTWDQADNDAKLRGGLLATISNKSENDHLLKISKKKKGWIGGHDSGFENSWNWVSGEPFKYQNWKKNQPDNAGNNEDYLEIQSDGQWNDLPGSYEQGYYLEKRIRTNPNMADSDGDGYNDRTEIMAKSNPNDRSSIPYEK
jgi:hypothetical protein